MLEPVVADDSGAINLARDKREEEMRDSESGGRINDRRMSVFQLPITFTFQT